MSVLENFNRMLVNLLTFIGGAMMVAMIVLTCANIFSRAVWGPVRGTFELMGYAGAVVTAFAMGYTQIRKGHIAVDILVVGYPASVKKFIHIVNCALCLLFFIIAAWQIAVKANTLMKTGEVTETLQIIYYPFTYAVALGCLVLALTLLIELLKAVLPQKENQK
jgi:TRAP-type C4-dicarboxylate transport system permease small subunit